MFNLTATVKTISNVVSTIGNIVNHNNNNVVETQPETDLVAMLRKAAVWQYYRRAEKIYTENNAFMTNGKAQAERFILISIAWHIEQLTDDQFMVWHTYRANETRYGVFPQPKEILVKLASMQ